MYAARKIRPLVWVIQAWNEEGHYIHVVASLSNKEDVEQAVSNILKVPDWKFNGLIVAPDQLSLDLPGIQNEAKHPITNEKQSLWSIIMDLNDVHKWTREQIADWIESLDDVPTFKV